MRPGSPVSGSVCRFCLTEMRLGVLWRPCSSASTDRWIAGVSRFRTSPLSTSGRAVLRLAASMRVSEADRLRRILSRIVMRSPQKTGSSLPTEDLDQ